MDMTALGKLSRYAPIVTERDTFAVSNSYGIFEVGCILFFSTVIPALVAVAVKLHFERKAEEKFRDSWLMKEKNSEN